MVCLCHDSRHKIRERFYTFECIIIGLATMTALLSRQLFPFYLASMAYYVWISMLEFCIDMERKNGCDNAKRNGDIEFFLYAWNEEEDITKIAILMNLNEWVLEGSIRIHLETSIFSFSWYFVVTRRFSFNLLRKITLILMKFLLPHVCQISKEMDNYKY